MLDSGDSTGIQLAAVLILLMLSAFFSSAETALTTVNKMRVRTLAEGGDKRAAMVAAVIEDPAKMLSTILIGNNIVNLSASSLMTTPDHARVRQCGGWRGHRCADTADPGIR
ncbi:MAG: CNNM domain-containing protein [Clostridium sp.]